MNRYLKYFRIPLIITAVITIICLFLYIGKSGSIDYERDNQVYDNTVCVYDYAGKMTDTEINNLNDYLCEIEQANCVDIAFVTIYDDDYAYLDEMKELSEATVIDWGMGFDGEGGNAVIFIDNWSRGGDGYIHSWIAARGERNRISGSDAENMLEVLDSIPNDEADPYEQYMQLAGRIERETRIIHPPYGIGVCLIIALVITALYIIINWKSKLADVTVNKSTYLSGGRAEFPVRRDIFINKTVSRRKIERSSSSSGGSSGGGFSGGGHSR